MSIYFTNAPEAYDYDSMVLKSVPLSMRFKGSPAGSFRMVVLDDREDGYYRDYQIGRYHSGMYLVMTPEKFEREVKEGYLEDDEVNDAAIVRKRVTIRQLEVDGKPMSASVFRQLPKRILINRRGLKLNGEPIGRVNYFWGSCNSMHLHVLWVDAAGDLNRDCVYVTRAKNEPPDHDWTAMYIELQKLPQLYIAGTDTE